MDDMFLTETMQYCVCQRFMQHVGLSNYCNNLIRRSALKARTAVEIITCCSINLVFGFFVGNVLAGYHSPVKHS